MTRDESWPVRTPIVSEHRAWAPPFARMHCPPGDPCGACGIHAYETYAHVEDAEPNERTLLNLGLIRARGIVAGWGHVIICQEGWRAGKAYPLALLEWRTTSAIHVVAKEYGIPVVQTVDDLIDVAEGSGAVSLAEYREE